MIGILCLQGDFLDHQLALKHLGVKNKLVRLPEHLFTCNALIIPGGESTTICKLIRNYGIGAQIIKDLKIKNMILITKSPKKVIGLEGYDIKITKQELI